VGGLQQAEGIATIEGVGGEDSVMVDQEEVEDREEEINFHSE